MEIRQQIAKSTHVFPGVNPCAYITIHETANRTVGAGAAAHANLQSKGNVRTATWHYQVDDKEVVQSFPDTTKCWHAGDGLGPGNTSSIGIEICVNADGDFEGALENAAWLVQVLQGRHAIPLDHVVQHNHWSGKNCPTNLRVGSRWSEFLGMVAFQDEPAEPAEPVSNPVTPAPPTPPASQEDEIMTKLPTRDWTRNSTAPVAADGRIQALLAAAGFDPGALDDYAGPQSRAALGRFQIATGTGTAGKADLIVGQRTWAALLGV